MSESARPRVAPFVALAVAVVLAALFVVLAGSESGGNDRADTFLEGQPAPGAAGVTLEGQSFDLSRRKGSWVVLNFFDPDCIPCQAEHPELILFDEQQNRLANGAELYTVVNKGSDEAVAAYFQQNGGDWPVVLDPTGKISADFGVAQVPETWIIDPDGIVIRRFVGQITADPLAAFIQQLRQARA